MWDQRYAEEAFAYGDAPNDFIRQISPRLPAQGSALCLAAGQGRNAVYLAERGLDVVAVDQSRVGLERATQLAESREVSIETLAADLQTFDLGVDRWQVITSVFFHLPVALRVALHRRVVAALAPGGWFALEAYTPAQLAYRTGGPPVAELMMSLDALTEELAGLSMVIHREIERDIHEGRYHKGRSAVVQVLAQKPAAGRSQTGTPTPATKESMTKAT